MILLSQPTSRFTYCTFVSLTRLYGVPYSCGVSQDGYGTDDDDETLKDDGCYWYVFVILFLR